MYPSTVESSGAEASDDSLEADDLGFISCNHNRFS